MAELTRPRERILQVADELFYTRGLRSVGVDEIVSKAGTAKTTLYAHFPSKDELIGTYLRRRSEAWRTHLAAELERRGGAPAEQIDAVFEVLGAKCASPDFHGCPFINAAAEYADETHPARLVGRQHRAWIRDLFAGLATGAGAADPDELAGQLSLLYDAAMVGSGLDPGCSAVQRAREAARVLVADALRPAGAQTADR